MNPFPGLRPFETREAHLFFGRERQCDELLVRLANRRMVAVVGASGSGKSSLVRAGLIPALERGYLPSAGTTWRIAVCRPGADPLGNLSASLCACVGLAESEAKRRAREIQTTLEDSSRGLVAAARSLLADDERLLLVVDQFEEVFRYRQLGGPAADERAADFVALLTSAAAASDANVWVVLTMRSDYLGDCVQFAGLPEALNDSQFLVPQMTRDQLKDAIEGPISVVGCRITPGLLQRLLHDVDVLAEPGTHRRNASPEPDPLPLLQHTLLRLWDVSAEARGGGQPIDLAHYESKSVGTLMNALDRHLEEAYGEIDDADGQRIVRRAFQRLTARDQRNRDVRQPTSFSELASVALGGREAAPDELGRVRTILGHFSQPGRSFLLFDRQDTVDIAHESLIRQWRRLADWVQEEATSRRLFTALADAADGWASERRVRSLYRGPELTEVLQWWKTQQPTAVWAGGDAERFTRARRFLRRSQTARWLGRLGAAAAALAIVALAGEYVYTQQQIAEQQGQIAQLLKQAERSSQRANEAEKQGEVAEAARLRAEAAQQRAAADRVTASSAATELEKVRQQLAEAEKGRAEATARVKQLQGELERRGGAPSAPTSAAQAPTSTAPAQSSTTPPGTVPQGPVSPPFVPGFPPSTAPSAAPSGGTRASSTAPAGTTPPARSSQPPPQPVVTAPQSSPGSQPPRSAGGNLVSVYREGVLACDLKDWPTCAAKMREALALQPFTPRLTIPMTGNRPAPYAPSSYLALALMSDALAHQRPCDAAAQQALSGAGAEQKTQSLASRVSDARQKCGF
jgi:energy-coupling factor transporter ATP-binding protein EcfA2